MIKFGHKGAISMDAIHGTNIPSYFLWCLLVFDDWNNGIPVAWMLTSRSNEKNLTMWLEPLQRHIDKDMPTFLPSCFLTIDAAKIQMLSNVHGQRTKCQCTCIYFTLSRTGTLISYSKFQTWGIHER